MLKIRFSKVLFIAILASILSVLFAGTALASSPDWGSVFSHADSWFGSSEGIALADSIVQYQLSDGGWRKDMTVSTSGDWNKSTIDNDTTTSQIKVLAKTYKQTNNSKYLTACQKGIDLLLNGQYSNGGWPQIFNDAGTYHAHITYNDNAMIHVMTLLTDVSKRSGDYTFIDSTRASKSSTAISKGIQCIINTQITSNGVKAAWCQQHDESTLKPTSARAYELPSNTASESVGIVNYLKSVSNPSSAVTNAINSAVAWMKKVQILGIKVVDTGDDRVVVSDPSAPPIWARFYELNTDRPMFVDRDGSIHYQMSELSQERRTGYAWYGNWPAKLVAGATGTPTPARSNTPTPTRVNTPTPTRSATPTPTIPSGGPAYQAEDAAYGNSAVFESTNSGYNGTGYINFPSSGGYLEFRNVDGGAGGVVTLKIRNALGATSSRTGRIQVNGGSWQNITFDPTGAWTTWTVKQVSVTLNGGTSNTIRIESTGQDLANIDELITGVGGSTSTPTPTLRPSSTPTPARSATATPTRTATATPTPTPGTGGYVVTYTVSSDWGSGGNVDVTIKNNTSTAVNGWTLVWTFPGNQTITNLWNGVYTQSGASVSVKDTGYNATIGANGGTTSFGFGMNYSGTNGKPTSFTLNGTACQVQ
jgi:PelA/Pel-15E family pectate lyase